VDEGGADSTREAILRAARVRFAIYPYLDVTLRDIGKDAGVSAPLVVKYFGTKDDLLRRVVDFGAVFADLLDAPTDDLGHHLVRRLSERIGDVDLPDPFLGLLLNSVGRDAPPWIRDELFSQFVHALAARLSEGDARLRAELVCAQLLGLSAMRRLLQAEEISVADPGVLAKRFGPSLQLLIDG
jgi:AcrR family transcriptional regulator